MKVEDILKVQFPFSVRYESGEIDVVFGICLIDDYIFTDQHGELSGYVKNAKIIE